MGRLFRDMVAFGTGAAVAYMFDPVTGRQRRADLMAQGRSQISDVASAAGAKTRYQSGKAKGWFYETFVPEKPPADDQELLQKIRSEAFGPTRGNVGHVDIRIEDGVVYLVGTSMDRAAEDELTERIADVTGVTEVRNELVPAS